MQHHKSELFTEQKCRRDYDYFEDNDGKPIPCYFNIGSGLYRQGFTCIEIEKGVIRLIKWSNEDGISELERRKKLWDELKISDLKESVISSKPAEHG